MNTYYILQHPGHNRVYYNLSGELALAELKIASTRLSINCEQIEVVDVSGIRYLAMVTDAEISEYDLQIISRLSFVFAIFRLDVLKSQTCLIPVKKNDYEYIDSKISSLLKYQGKTNELFTKMMVNIALLSSNFDFKDDIKLLDPVAGRGTTLYEGLIYGFEVTGIEIDAKAAEACSLFFKKYLEVERYKHLSQTRMVYGQSKSDGIYTTELEFSTNKEDFKDERLRHKLGIITGSTLETANYLKPESQHIIVGDLPYGISHANSTGKSNKQSMRNPYQLLKLCLPQWHKVLKPGGVVVIAWNSFLVEKHKLDALFTENDFDVFVDAPYSNFEHMVDKAIKRDIVVAKKR